MFLLLIAFVAGMLLVVAGMFVLKVADKVMQFVFDVFDFIYEVALRLAVLFLMWQGVLWYMS